MLRHGCNAAKDGVIQTKRKLPMVNGTTYVMLLPIAFRNSHIATSKRLGIHGRMKLGTIKRKIPTINTGFLPHL